MIDLFTVDLAYVSGPALYTAIEEFTQCKAAPDQRTQEGYRVDFKEEWNEKSLRVVAAFANTLGGVLIVGVSEANGRAKDIVGEASARELKTRIAGSISANITPTPIYDIAECELAGSPDRRLCVIRVRPANRIHFLTKGNAPVYVRNEDQAIPARAPELQALILREREGANPQQHYLDQNLLAQRLPISKVSVQPGHTPDARIAADSVLRVWMYPKYGHRIVLDHQIEAAFFKVVTETFPKDSFSGDYNWNSSTATRRDRTYVRIDHQHVQRDIESKWLLTENGEFGYATLLAIDGGGTSPYWSLADVTAELLAVMRAAHTILLSTGYLGEAQLFVSAQLERGDLYQERGQLPYLRHATAGHTPTTTWRDIAPDTRSGQTNRGATAWSSCAFHTRTSELVVFLADVLNQLLRDFGYAVDRNQLASFVKEVAG